MGAPELPSSQLQQLQIRFITKQEQYSVPDTPFAVPSSVTAIELNNLLKELLRETSDAVLSDRSFNFDFLAVGEFIRTSLGEHIIKRNFPTESVIDVEYVERLPAPQPKDCLLHDDWVSAVHVAGDWILTGCYDNTVHLWSKKGKHKLTIPGHTSCVKAVSWISTKNNTATFVSGSHDQTALLWEWNVDQNIVECVHVCKGHSRGIECIGVNTDGSQFATGSWDAMLKIWNASTDWTPDNDENEGETQIKRAKLEKKSQIRTPLITLKGHKESISGLCWKNNSELVTASWDHTLRMWDIEVAASIREIPGNKAFFDVHLSPISGLLITASSDRHVRLYDPRSSEGSLVKSNFSSHSKWVQTVRWSTTDENLFISGAYDKQLKLWDIRSPRVPMFDMSGHEDKVLCSDWSEPSLMVSGGADNTLRIFKAKNVQKMP